VPTDLLFTIAEVGVAFAGFAGLVTVLAARERRSAERAALDLAFLHTVLATSLTVVAFALLPPSLVEMGVEAETALRICAALFLCVSIGYGSWAGPRTGSTYRAANERPPGRGASTSSSHSINGVSLLCAPWASSPARSIWVRFYSFCISPLPRFLECSCQSGGTPRLPDEPMQMTRSRHVANRQLDPPWRRHCP
jgi:hypothetical protein